MAGARGQSIIADLTKDYLENANTLLPIVTRQELEAEADGLLGYTAALVASTRKDTPADVYRALRQLVNQEIVDQGKHSSDDRGEADERYRERHLSAECPGASHMCPVGRYGVA